MIKYKMEVISERENLLIKTNKSARTHIES